MKDRQMHSRGVVAFVIIIITTIQVAQPHSFLSSSSYLAFVTTVVQFNSMTASTSSSSIILQDSTKSCTGSSSDRPNHAPHNHNNANWIRQKWVANLKKQTEQKKMVASNDSSLDAGGSPSSKSVEPFLTPTNGSFANSRKDGDHGRVCAPTSEESSSSSSRTNTFSELSTSASAQAPPRVWTKRLLKKRTSRLSEVTRDEEDDPAKPHTPRRKLNCGNVFEDASSSWSRKSQSQNQDPHSPTSRSFVHHMYHPHPQVDHHNWWNMTHEPHVSRDDLSLMDPHPRSSNHQHHNHSEVATEPLSFEFDTRCLDGYLGLVSPRFMTSSSGLDLGFSPHAHVQKKKTDFSNKPPLAHEDVSAFAPKLIRTESIEQSALTAYFKHTLLSSPASPRLTTEDLFLCHNVVKSKASTDEDFDFHSLLPQDCELNSELLDQELDAYYFENLPVVPTSELQAIE